MASFPNPKQLYQHNQIITTESFLTNGAAANASASGRSGRLWSLTFRFDGKLNGQITATLRDAAVADGSGTTLAVLKTGIATAAGQGSVLVIPLLGLQFNRGCTIQLADVNGTPPAVTDGSVDVLWEGL